MPATSEFRRAERRLKDLRNRLRNPRDVLKAIGTQALRTHAQYFRKGGSQTSKGGGPPGAPWPGLEESTVHRKLHPPKGSRRGARTRKLVMEGTLMGGFEIRLGRYWVKIINKAKHAVFLQRPLKRKKKFIVVVPSLKAKKYDPELYRKIRFIAGRWLRTGKRR